MMLVGLPARRSAARRLAPAGRHTLQGPGKETVSFLRRENAPRPAYVAWHLPVLGETVPFSLSENGTLGRRVCSGWPELLANAGRLLVALAGLWVAAAGRLAAAEQRLLEREPFDRITLDAENKHAVLEVAPLELPGRRLPAAPNADEKLIVRLLERPEKRYELRFGAIERVELFEQMLLAEAQRLVGEGRLEEAYEYFARLEREYPELSELAPAMEAYLYEEAKAAFRASDFHRALAMLWEIHQRNPQRPGLDKALGMATEQLVQRYVAAEKFPAARALTRRLERAFPGHAVAAIWHQRWREEAAALLAQARSHVAANELAEASAACRRIARLWPALPGAGELAAEVHERYPRVVVGVCHPLHGQMREKPMPIVGAGAYDAAARRVHPLLYRTIAELAGGGEQGGSYICPVGQLSVDCAAATLLLKIDPDARWQEGQVSLSAGDVARCIAELAGHETSGLGRAWGFLLAEAEVRGVFELHVRLRHPWPRPEALLRISVPPYAQLQLAGSGHPVPNGPYRLVRADSAGAVFAADLRYALGSAWQGPKELVEQYVPDAETALRMLRAGELDVIERVPPHLVTQLECEAGITVGACAVPRVHCLVPNQHKSLPACQTFRRAVLYGIHRKAILNRLLQGAEVNGCQVASGPFAAGEGTDLLGTYAADPKIAPRPYDPHLATALLRAALEEVGGRLPEGSGGASAEAPQQCRISIALPAGELARQAGSEIRRQLGLIGIDVELIEQGAEPKTVQSRAAAGDLVAEDSAADFCYVELAMAEPLADVWELIGPGRLVEAGPAMQIGLRRLAEAEDWPALCRALNILHRLFHDELAVIPLWQLTDHYAARADLAGFSPQAITLYQHVGQWRPAFRYPREPQANGRSAQPAATELP